MRLLSLALIAALSTPLPVLAAPTQGEIAAARLAYIDGDLTGALVVISEAAEAGNGMALNILGAANDEGRSVQKVTFKAVDLFEQAPKPGEVRAYYNLGSIFALGSSEVAMDRKRAGLEFKAAAGLG